MPNLTDRIKTALLRIAHALQAPAVANLKDRNALLRDELRLLQSEAGLYRRRCRRAERELTKLKQQLARHMASNPQYDRQQETHHD